MQVREAVLSPVVIFPIWLSLFSCSPVRFRILTCPMRSGTRRWRGPDPIPRPAPSLRAPSNPTSLRPALVARSTVETPYTLPRLLGQPRETGTWAGPTRSAARAELDPARAVSVRTADAIHRGLAQLPVYLVVGESERASSMADPLRLATCSADDLPLAISTTVSSVSQATTATPLILPLKKWLTCPVFNSSGRDRAKPSRGSASNPRTRRPSWLASARSRRRLTWKLE